MSIRRFFLALICVPAFAIPVVYGAAGGIEEGISYTPGIELPPGQGRALLSRVCTKCHDLKGVPAYKGYWNRDRWQAMVETMIKNGAELNHSEAALVIDYLTEHFGPEK